MTATASYKGGRSVSAHEYWWGKERQTCPVLQTWLRKRCHCWPSARVIPSRNGSRFDETSRKVFALAALTADTRMTASETASMAAVRTTTKVVAPREPLKPTSS